MSAGSTNSLRAPFPEARSTPSRGRVLVLAPHADDEIIGVGGTLALHAEAQDEIDVLVVFDGAEGLARGVDPRVRREEALRGGAHIGVSRYEFWSYPEGHEPSRSDFDSAVARLAEHIAACGPRILYAPWIGEHHLDHHTLARAAQAALATLRFEGEAWAYEVWTPLVAERVVDVTKVWERKLAALREHESQLAHTDLLHKMTGLAAHRSLYLGRDARYGEAFARLLGRAPGAP